jgi:hypothetical protein
MTVLIGAAGCGPSAEQVRQAQAEAEQAQIDTERAQADARKAQVAVRQAESAPVVALLPCKPAIHFRSCLQV